MKKLLISLYPAAWRARYGAELEALMADAPERNFDVLKGAFAMRLRYLPVWAILPALVLVGALAGWLASYSVTEEWEAKAVMQVTPAVFDGAGFQAVNEQIMKLRAAVESRASLARLIVDPRLNLYEEERRSQPIEDIEDAMRQRILIAINPGSATRAGAVVFTISFRYPDAKKSQDTVSALIVRFIDESEGIQPPPYHVSMLDAPSRPAKPLYPRRPSFAAAGGVAGFIIAFFALLIRRRTTPGLQAA